MFDAKDSVPSSGDSFGGEQIAAPAVWQPRAGNTVDSLRPINSGLKSSERLVTEGLTTKPEPIEVVAPVVVREAAKTVLANADKIDEALATQGEQLDRAKVLEAATIPIGPPASEARVIAFAKDTTSDNPAAYITRDEFTKLKENWNDSMTEVANMLLDLQQANVSLEERIAKYNQRGGHRI